MKGKGKKLLLICLTTLLIGYTTMINTVNAATPKVYVDPPVKIDNTLTPGKNFTISIKISNAANMWGFNIRLRWGPTILDLATVTEGNFLKWGGSVNPQPTMFRTELNQTAGTLFIACTLKERPWPEPPTDPVSGNGTLATIKFTVQEVAATVLDLYNTEVSVINPLDPPPRIPYPTEHDSEGGFFSNVLSATYDIALTGVVRQKTAVCVGYTLDIYVAVRNKGNVKEAFAISIYYNSNVAAGAIVTLSIGASTNTTITWDTTGVAKGTYTISANASIAPGETNTTDNTLVDGTVIVTIPGDVNGDRTVDIFDVVIVAAAFGSTPSDPNWDVRADLKPELGLIDIFDFMIVAANFGESW